MSERMSASATGPIVVSVVIPCRNGAVHLGALLDSLRDEEPPFNWEIIVADNGSTDGTAELVETYSGGMPLRLVGATARRGAAYARNAGAAAAQGHFVVFIDADDVVAPGYMSKMKAALDLYGFAAATMDSVHLNPPWAVRAMRAVSTGGLDSGPFPWHSAGMLGMKRALFETVGGFDEEFDPGEDADLCWRIQAKTGVRPQLCDAVVWHRLRETPAGMFKQGRWHGRANPHLLARWGPSGMMRPAWRRIGRRWLASLAHLTLGVGSKAHRGRGLFLLGLTVGQVEGSIRHRVLYP